MKVGKPRPLRHQVQTARRAVQSARRASPGSPSSHGPGAMAPYPTVTATERAVRNAHTGCVVWLTGLSGSGKTTLASALERVLFDQGNNVCVLDGDNLRRGLCSDLGFSPLARKENIRRAGEVARLFAERGFICIAAFISPYRSERDLARRIAPQGKFIEVFLNAPLEVCEQRDPKGLYARARAGQLRNFTGISAPYQVPKHPELELRTDRLGVSECVALLLNRLKLLGKNKMRSRH